MTAPKPQRSLSEDTAEAESALREALDHLVDTAGDDCWQSDQGTDDAEVRYAAEDAKAARADVERLFTVERTAREEAEKARDLWERLCDDGAKVEIARGEESWFWEGERDRLAADLLALARMYGEACGELWIKHHLLQGVADEADGADLSGVEQWASEYLRQRDTAEAERDRLAENARLRAALQSIADQCPVTCDMSLAHMMAAEADCALTSTKGADDA